MNAQIDLELYPRRPGWKKRATSRSAANEMRGRANTLRNAVLECLTKWGWQSADECAEWMEESVLAVRPRISELAKMGLIEDSGQRRENDSGKNAIVWKLRRIK